MSAYADLREGDCLEVLAAMDTDSVDAIVTDPPYGIGFMGEAWDQPGMYGSGVKPPRGQQGNRFHRDRKVDHKTTTDRDGAMEAGRYDMSANASFQQWCTAWGEQLLRVAKPGTHAVVFGGPRTFHRLVSGMEDAGWEVRDTLMWLFGSGFPKSLNLDGEHEGWGTALKPGYEPILLARKPLAGTVAANLAEHGVGALHIDACRIPSGDDHRAKCESVVGLDSNRNGNAYGIYSGMRESSWSPAGRWPANVVLDQNAADQLDAHTGDRKAGGAKDNRGTANWGGTGVHRESVRVDTFDSYGDSGGASRFFYQAKASALDRGGSFNTHPTVKPIDLMRWLIRLVTPAGGTVLDPFAGSGTTGVAALIEGARPVLIERDPEYAEIIRRRLAQPIQPTLGSSA